MVVEVDEEDEFFGFVVVKSQHEAGVDVDSFEAVHGVLEVFVVLDGRLVGFDDLVDFFVDAF